MFVCGIVKCFSVEAIEGTVQQLVEDNDCVVGVRYKSKGFDDTQVKHPH